MLHHVEDGILRWVCNGNPSLGKERGEGEEIRLVGLDMHGANGMTIW